MAQALLLLKKLESLKFEFGPQTAAEKLRCLEGLKSAQLNAADQVSRLHEVLCFMQAWPDDAAVMSLVDSMLDRFDSRQDLRRHAEELANTGIAGTAIHFSFYAVTAKWLASRWPDRLHVDWDAFENAAILERFLSLLGTYSETSALDSFALELRVWIDQLKGPFETDAIYVIRRLAALIANDCVFEQLYEELDVPLILSPGRGGPSRTRARYDKSPIVYQTTPLDRTRPVVHDESRRTIEPPRRVSRAEGIRLVDLAHSVMVTRERDLDAFAYADPNDVSLMDDDRLQLAIYGVPPERRFLLETLYGFIVLKSGVPICYGAVTCLFNSAEMAYSNLDTFRGGESARIFVRALAMVYQVFGCDTVMIDPYQLGADNEDALKSGAWWFYQKLGFRPRDTKLLRLMERELSLIKRRPGHRSSREVLEQLAAENVYLNLGKQRDDVVGMLELANIGMKITDLFARRFGSDRELGETTLAEEAGRRLGVSSFRGWAAGQKLAWRRWSPLVALLNDLNRWPDADREALVQLIRAKGGRQEIDYLKRFDDHERLRKAIVTLAAED